MKRASLWKTCTRLEVFRPFLSAQQSSRGMAFRVLAANGHSSDPWVSKELDAKVKDKAVLKVHGFIGGEWLPATDGSTLNVHNPCNGEVIARVPNMKANETSTAIAAAGAVWPSWSGLTAKERSKIMRRWYDLVLEAEEDICNIMTAESGKPFAESQGEFQAGCSSIEWFAEECRRITGDVLQTVNNGQRMLVLKQPIGVVAAITPWCGAKFSSCGSMGEQVILKPAEATPLTALALAALAQRAGIPDGVLNIVVGDPKAIGDKLLESNTVRKIGFTGSTRIGKQLMAGAAPTVKRVSLELGGNAPFLVFDDADPEEAAAGFVTSAFRNAGQTCICANRVFVQEGIYDEFAAAVTAKVRKFKLGDGAMSGTTLGPLINAAAVDRVEEHVEDARSKGAAVLTGGARPQLEGKLADGHFFEPTVVADATIDMRIYREETFGPAVMLLKFKHDHEAIQYANDTEYGLAAYYYTKDLARAWKVAEQLEYGIIGCNGVGVGSEVAPFGGVKHSGLGRELSKYGIEEFLAMKYVQFGVGYRSL